ncbi:hypothetical protein [Planctomyces sp. SH-PL62]|uniref:hypothetical protein n=1 Tax=Planctomyces sp. SH-PL62 TaxID=1636152 RepID=UPI00078B2DD5|nr:hypothetical protein [Planctomyces sp. SH-PL62]AMV37712.1 hypothetical protein VT85_09765 [Planctomyces sp. SH-PL62]
MADASASESECCLVISHYNAWPTDQLVALLDQTLEIPAGVPFHTRVVVNQARPIPLSLPERHAHVEVFHRPNLGYNIGAWDHGWRMGEPFEFYLFLQEECILLRRDWMKRFRDAASAPGVGLVGESLGSKASWTRLRGESKGLKRLFDYPRYTVPAARYEMLTKTARERGIDLGRDGRHLQSLIFAARREVLERIDGFEATAVEYSRAVISEILASKAVTTTGLEVRQAGWLPFSVISHPQWKRPMWQEVLEATVLRGVPPRLRWLSFLAYYSLKTRAARVVSWK